MFQNELQKFTDLLQQHRIREDDFAVAQRFLPPEEAADGMFPLRYEVSVTKTVTWKTATYVGGIGFDWVGEFDEDLKCGVFD